MRKFEAIPVEEVLKKATEVHTKETPKKVMKGSPSKTTHSRGKPGR